MRKTLGVAGFGIEDCVSTHQVVCSAGDFFLADAILPSHPIGRILTGQAAKEERIHTGLHWPLDARIEAGKPLRRAPIPCVWRALVEAGDQSASWDAGNGVRVPLARILANHIGGLIHGNVPGEKKALDIMPVVAIPDHLDEFGQEQLLREMKDIGGEDTRLIWRPVAAALAWLNEAEGDFPRHMSLNDPDSHIHVVYLGPDAVEFTTFRLRVKEHNKQLYVLPLRDRPIDAASLLTGMDWAGQIINESFEELDAAAFWQAFTIFPEVWQAIARRSWETGELPRPWSKGEKWTLWNPSQDLEQFAPETKAIQNQMLRHIVKASCELKSETFTSKGSMKDYLSQSVKNLSTRFPNGQLRGMIICGPLAPKKIPEWLEQELHALCERGLSIDGDLSKPQAGCLWLPDAHENPVARGAAIYGERILQGIPAYLDTLPQLALLAHDKGRYVWVPLLDAQEWPGGEEFSDHIRDRFQLNKGHKKLHVYLFKGPRENAPEEPPDPSDPRYLPSQGLTSCNARLIRELVRHLRDLKHVEHVLILELEPLEARYGISFARTFFGQDEKEEEAEANNLKEPNETPFRKAVFDFPAEPDNDVVLDVSVRMFPASGLARVELIPHDASFLDGERVRLNYERMRRTEKLPRRRRGWPPLQELVTDPLDSDLKNQSNLVERFEKISVSDINYAPTIDRIRDNVLKKMAPFEAAQQQFYIRAIDHNGEACTADGNELVQRIADKFQVDFPKTRPGGLAEKIVTRAAWLYTSTPKNIVDFMRNVLSGDLETSRWNDIIYSAGRSFCEPHDFTLLFRAIAENTRERHLSDIQGRNAMALFPIASQRAICCSLMFRRDSEKSLDSETARYFSQHALKRLKVEEEREGNFKTLYFQLIRLLLYLLRCRRSNPSCFDPNDKHEIEPFLEAITSMKNAEKHLIRDRQTAKSRSVRLILEGFEKYLYYEGSEETLIEINELAGDA